MVAVVTAHFLGGPGSRVKEDKITSYPKDSLKGALHLCQPSAPEEDVWKGRDLKGRVADPWDTVSYEYCPGERVWEGSPGQQRGLWVGFDH